MKSAGRPSHFTTAEQMNVQMVNGLTAVIARVQDDSEAAVSDFEFSGEFGHHVNKNVRGKFFVFRLKVRDALNVFLRDNQHVLKATRLESS